MTRSSSVESGVMHAGDSIGNIHNQEDAAVEFARIFVESAGNHVGQALASEIHRNPKVAKTAAAGAGVGFGLALGAAVVLAVIEHG